MRNIKLFAIGTCVLLSGCMVGPDYKEPKTNVATHWPKKNSSVKETPVDHLTWWDMFHDKTLSDLICRGYHDNLTVQMAGVRVLQARARLAQSVGELYPQQQQMIGTLDYYRIGGGYLDGVLPSNFYAATLGFSVNWEIDFWGKYRRAIQSNDASFLASIAAYNNALVTLTADIANAYIQIRMNESLIRVTKENIKLQRMSLQLTLSRFDAGEVSLLDVEQAKTELAETEAQLPALVSALQQQKDALAVLLGIVPNDVDALLLKKQGIPRAPGHVAVGIPKEMLARRPDIHQTRLEAIAQSAAIGVKKAQLFPSLALAGTFTFSSNTINNNSLSSLFDWSNLGVVTGPSLNWPLLNYGQITNNVRAQDAVFQEALLKYINQVLVAQKEVQDNITRYIEAKKTENYLTNASRSAIKATQLTIIQYKEGEDQYTTVLYAEQQQLRVQTSLVKAEAEVPLALVALYRALGGGWQIKQGNDVVPAQIKHQMAARTNWGNLLQEKNHLPPVNKHEKLKQLLLPNW